MFKKYVLKNKEDWSLFSTYLLSGGFNYAEKCYSEFNLVLKNKYSGSIDVSVRANTVTETGEISVIFVYNPNILPTNIIVDIVNEFNKSFKNNQVKDKVCECWLFSCKDLTDNFKRYLLTNGFVTNLSDFLKGEKGVDSLDIDYNDFINTNSGDSFIFESVEEGVQVTYLGLMSGNENNVANKIVQDFICTLDDKQVKCISLYEY